MENNFTINEDEVFVCFEELSEYFRKNQMEMSYAEIFDLAIKLKAYDNSFEAAMELQSITTSLQAIEEAIADS